MSARPARTAHLIAVALVLGVAGLIFVQTRSYGLLGMDSYPIILTSRVQSLGDLWGNFSERLMDGYYPADFYRPLLNLSFALDYALWGLSAAGYQLSNVLYFAGCAAALYAFLISRPATRAWSPQGGSRPAGYALVGVSFFLFHPLQFEVLPFPPRRPELLCSMFVLLALAAEAHSGWRSRVLSGAATLLALASKETAAILPALVFFRVLLYPGPDQRRVGGVGDEQRLRWFTAGRRAGLSAVSVVVYLAARFAVLGGMGGRGSITPAIVLEAIPENLVTLLRTVTFPASPDSWTMAGIWLLLGLPLLIAAIWRRGSDRQPWLTDLGFSAVWLVLLASIYSLSGRLSPWYTAMAIVPFGVALSGICEGYGSWLRQSSGQPGSPESTSRWSPIGRGAAYRTAGAAGLIGVVMLLSLSQLRWSPVFRSYPLWRRATVEDRAILARFKKVLEQAEAGSMTRILADKKKIKGKGAALMFQGVVLQAHYSLQAWAALFYPDREVRVLKNRRPLKTEPLKPSEVVVILDRVPKPKKKSDKGGQQKLPANAQPNKDKPGKVDGAN